MYFVAAGPVAECYYVRKASQLLLVPWLPTINTEARFWGLLYADKYMVHAALSKPMSCLTRQQMELTPPNHSLSCDSIHRSYRLKNQAPFPSVLYVPSGSCKKLSGLTTSEFIPKAWRQGESQLRNDTRCLNDFNLVLLQLNFTTANFYISFQLLNFSLDHRNPNRT